MKKLLLTVATLAAFGTPGFAADMALNKAPPPIPSWTGFYLGVGAGERASTVDGSVNSAVNTSLGALPSLNLLTGPGGSCVAPNAPCVGESLNGTAFRFSPYAGYNFQIGSRWVVGVEGDGGLADKTTTLGGLIYPGGGSPFFITGRGDDSFSVKTSWDASIRGRLGFLASSTLLVYGTGGAAWQRVVATSTCGVLSACTGPGAFAPATFTDSTTKSGYTVGAGLEAMVSDHWLVRAEYRYSGFGTINNSDVRTCVACAGGVGIAQTVNYSLKMTTQTATFGLAYKF